MAPYVSVIFLSAFLLFQVQPVIARYILPWYGGSPSVWSACLLFFQIGLLVGYAYAHLLVKYLTPQRQVIVHISILLLTLAVLPITPDASLKPDGSEQPLISILYLLLVTVGAPYILISSTGPLIQHWFSRLYTDKSPYRLYALSNLGSLLGLLTYPFLVEPNMQLGNQTLVWSLAYTLFVGFTLWSGRTVFSITTLNPVPAKSSIDTDWWRKILWILLPACGTIVLLSGTNKITQDVAVIPFLWILPLSLYLITYIIAFDNERWYHRGFWVPALALAVSAATYMLLQDYADHEIDLHIQVLIYSAAIFTCCMVCHGEVVRIKPDSQGLTGFYLAIALGGALGGSFVSLIAPIIFTGFWELHIGYVLTIVVLGLCLYRNQLTGKPISIKSTAVIAWSVLIVVLGKFLLDHVTEQKQDSIAVRRNFYGVINVYQEHKGQPNELLAMYHGRINHGTQLQNKRRRRNPTTYYSHRSGLAQAINYHPKRIQQRKEIASAVTVTDTNNRIPVGLNVGVIGLGAGTSVAHNHVGDSFRYYEINDQVIELANQYFSYIKDTPGEVEVVLGDARVSLEKELQESGPQLFDILTVDAFSGDAIPVHLITDEAFDLYWKHLKQDGILAVHITNLHINLEPIVRNLAKKYNKQAVLFSNDASSRHNIYYADWVLITSNKRFLNHPKIKKNQNEWEHEKVPPIYWTDDYSNLFQVLM